jgi:hypothetical protein
VTPVIVKFKGPPITVNLYHPSLLKVPVQVAKAGKSAVVSLIKPLPHAPFIVIGVAVSQVVPCPKALLKTNKQKTITTLNKVVVFKVILSDVEGLFLVK